MEKIDLTKCNNCRYKVKIDGDDDYGRICIENADSGLAFLRSDVEGGYIATWHCDVPGIDGCSGRKVTDFEIVPRDPETYRDWQVGDLIGCLDEEGDMDIMADHLCRIIFRSGELVAVAENYSEDSADINGCYTCSQLLREGWRLVLTDIERQIIEERKKYEPQDGDIVAWKYKEDNEKFAITISKGKEYGYFTLFANGTIGSSYCTMAMNIIRPATEEEKRLLFDAMAKQGKRWNAEKKVVEDIPKPYDFGEGEPVLVRNYDDDIWKLAVFRKRSGNASYPYEVRNQLGNYCCFRKCIPYNGETMHLLGIYDDYKEGK